MDWMWIMRTSRRIGMVCLVTGMACVAGCKTDSLAQHPDRMDEGAPVTSLENPAGVEMPAIPVTDRTEVDLVEDLIRHRAMYARYLQVLVEYYRDHGLEYKAKWALNELNDLKRVKPYRYILDAEVPVVSLQPTESVAEADRLYNDGLALMKKGGHNVPVFYNQETMKLALSKFKQLIDRYSTSDKIDDAAFYIGEIHKEYFEEKDNRIALMWYQRAIDWNPDTPHPARFQMAVVYDYRLHEREKALAMYQAVLEHETFEKSNVNWAKQRIIQLTSEETRHAAGEPVEPLPPESEETSGQAMEASPPGPDRVP